MPERLPPQNIEAEKGVLGSVLLDPATIHDVEPVVGPDDFYRDAHATLYRRILAVHGAGDPVDPITVHGALVAAGEFDRVGGNDLLVEVMESVPHAAHAAYYAELVRQKAIARDVIEAANHILREAYSDQHTAQELAALAERAVFAVGDRRSAFAVRTIGEAVAASLRRMEERLGGVVPGLRTGLGEFDATTGGLGAGHLVVLAARPSIGKTALALNLAEHAVLAEGRPTLFVSLEMTGEELADRLLCGRADIPGGKYARPEQLSDVDFRALGLARERLGDAPLYIDDAPARSIREVAALARRYRARHAIGLLVVDYLQLVDPDDPRGRAPRHELVAAMSRDLKRLAKALDIPVLLLCQLNREVEKREGKKPQLADLRESGGIEQDANMVLLLHRPEFYDRNDRPGEADLIIAKNRGGPTGTIKLRFRKETTTFTAWGEPLAPGHEYGEGAPY